LQRLLFGEARADLAEHRHIALGPLDPVAPAGSQAQISYIMFYRHGIFLIVVSRAKIDFYEALFYHESPRWVDNTSRDGGT
jgi:hypothetical protein